MQPTGHSENHRHEVRILENADVQDYYSEPQNMHYPWARIATISVRPPIAVGDLFERHVLGEDRDGVTIGHIVTTAGMTVLRAVATKDHSDDRVDDIETIRERVNRIVNNPHDLLFIDQNPFPHNR